MKFKPGDKVIKITGGNKMIVTEVSEGRVTCMWATEDVHIIDLPEDDLTTLDAYELTFTRDQKINELLGRKQL
jgi:uncharacterized protein YodC (DUF2158 family)